MSGDLPWLDEEWMRGAHRGQVYDAVAYALRALVEHKRSLETSCHRINGSGFDPGAVREIRALEAAASGFEKIAVGVRGEAIAVAKANKAAGKEYHRLPVWIIEIADQMQAAFLAPINGIDTREGEYVQPSAKLEVVA